MCRVVSAALAATVPMTFGVLLHCCTTFGVAGIVGALGLAILMAPTFGGVGFDEGVSMASQFVIQAKSVGITIVWCAIATFVLYKIVNFVVGMRVSDESERTGLDTTSHGETAYHS